MPASPASVSSEAGGAPVLVCGANWIGDSLMSMPALQALRRRQPGARLVLLVKPHLFALWRLHTAPDLLLPLRPGLAGALAAARAVRAVRAGRACVLPRSFRAALIPFLAGVPVREGLPGHGRDFLLTRIVRPELPPGRRHQACEYLQLLAPEAAAAEPERPRLAVPPEAVEAAHFWLAALPQPVVGLLPGAARGPAKRWPATAFVEVGRWLAREARCGVVVVGARREAGLCAGVARAIGPPALNLAGRTDLAEWAAVLQACAAVVCNDSGGMHLAAALGTPVVAIFGLTDPDRTGPLGRRGRILQASAVRARDIPRRSAEAQKVLERITPEAVYGAVQDVLQDGEASRGGE